MLFSFYKRKRKRKEKKLVVMNVIPDPVGPIKRTLLFSSSTFSSSSNMPEIPESAPDLVLKSTILIT